MCCKSCLYFRLSAAPTNGLTRQTRTFGRQISPPLAWKTGSCSSKHYQSVAVDLTASSKHRKRPEEIAVMVPLRSTSPCVGVGWRRPGSGSLLIQEKSYLLVINSILLFTSSAAAWAEICCSPFSSAFQHKYSPNRWNRVNTSWTGALTSKQLKKKTPTLFILFTVGDFVLALDPISLKVPNILGLIYLISSIEP